MKNITLTKDQDAANNGFLDFLISSDKYLIIQGSAGTGKSFLIKHLINTFYNRYSAYCLLCNEVPKEVYLAVTATTNKAVTVLEDFLYDVNRTVDIKTIYQYLGLRIVNNYSTGETELQLTKDSICDPSNANYHQAQNGMSVVFIDEASFINEELHDIIDQHVSNGQDIKIVLIGDQYQLAPVKQKFSVFENTPSVKLNLNEVMRNAGHILKTGVQFKETVANGKFTPIVYDKSNVVHMTGPEFQQAIYAAFTDPDWEPDKAKILAWTNSRVQEYNKHIRKTLNLSSDFAIGEYVVTNNFISNNNFTISVDSQVCITHIFKEEEREGIKGTVLELNDFYTGFLPHNYDEVKVLLRKLAKQKDWAAYFSIKDKWLDLRAVYASSIHKAQGSTYETVFIDLTDIGRNWQANDVARLLYVAITRASKQVICYGELPTGYRG